MVQLLLEPQVLLLDMDCMGAGDVPTRLSKIFDELSHYCKREAIPLHMTGLTRTLVHLSKDCDYPCGKHSCNVIDNFHWVISELLE